MTNLDDLVLQIETLDDVKSLLDERGREFADSLIRQFNDPKKAGLSDKQIYWVGALILRARGEQPIPAGGTNVGSVKGIVDLLDRATKHLKHPAILARANEMNLRLNIAGDHARVPGSINVTTVGSFDNRDWLGRITREGDYQPSGRVDPASQTAIAAALTALATDPAQAAKEYGKLTGHCCFCGLPLTDPQSTDRGYGPVCATHWGLPWGGRAYDQVLPSQRRG